MNFIDELKNYLVSNTSLVFGTDLFIGKLPDETQDCVVLTKSTSPAYQYNFNNTYGYNQENILIRVRGKETENTARALAKIVQDALENLSNETLGTFYLIRGVFETPMYQLEGRDTNNNFIYVGVYSAIIE